MILKRYLKGIRVPSGKKRFTTHLYKSLKKSLNYILFCLIPFHLRSHFFSKNLSSSQFLQFFISAKIGRICCQSPTPRFTIPFNYDLRLSAPKYNSITHAATAMMNLYAAIPMRSAGNDLQNKIE